MNTSNAVRAEILTQAVPYIKEYTGKYVVAKYGGNAMTDPQLKKSVMQDILLLQLVGVKVILVHGGGPEISAMLEKLSIESHFENGLRVTDDDTMEVVQMVLAGKVNKSLAADLSALGGRAVGLRNLLLPDGGIIPCGGSPCGVEVRFACGQEGLHRFQHQHGAHAHLRAMGDWTLPLLLEHHFPVMGHVVFTAGGRTGISI